MPSTPLPFNLRRYRRDIRSRSHDSARLVLPLDGAVVMAIPEQAIENGARLG